MGSRKIYTILARKYFLKDATTSQIKMAFEWIEVTQQKEQRTEF
jgi:hypothetical protein